MLIQVYVDIGDRTSHLLTFRVYLWLEHTFLLEKLNLGVKNVFAAKLCEIFRLTAWRYEIRRRKRQQVDFLIECNFRALRPPILIWTFRPFFLWFSDCNISLGWFVFLLTFHVVFSVNIWLIYFLPTFLKLPPFFWRQTWSFFLLAGLYNIWMITNYCGAVESFSSLRLSLGTLLLQTTTSLLRDRFGGGFASLFRKMSFPTFFRLSIIDGWLASLKPRIALVCFLNFFVFSRFLLIWKVNWFSWTFLRNQFFTLLMFRCWLKFVLCNFFKIWSFRWNFIFELCKDLFKSTLLFFYNDLLFLNLSWRLFFFSKRTFWFSCFLRSVELKWWKLRNRLLCCESLLDLRRFYSVGLEIDLRLAALQPWSQFILDKRALFHI